MSVCFSIRSSLRGSQRKEREKGGKMSLFSLKKHSLSLSLSFSSALSLSFFDTFWLSIRFFFLSFALLFVVGEIKALVFSLFFPRFCWGDRKPHPFVSLSLSLTKSAFWKTRSPYRTLRGTRRERGIIVSEKEEIDASDTLAR